MMDEQNNPALDRTVSPEVSRSDTSKLPIKQDTAVEVSTGPDGREIESVKGVFRPPELLSQPIKSYWTWIWVVVIAVFILSIVFLAWYFTNHHAPSSAASIVTPTIHFL